MKRVLIANRGEIARRVIYACRELGIETVAVYSDLDAGAPFVELADQAVPLGGLTPTETYLDLEKLIAAARRTSADAVHPGYGFLSEQPALARACVEAGLRFVGPPAEVMERVGDKRAARAAAAEAEVPVIPGRGGDDPQQLLRVADEVGFPVLIKAVHGGGGKGMRLVEERDAFRAAAEAAGREAAAAFGSPEIYVEKALLRPRHIEVQILADEAGRVVHLGERECSVQRRHQKIVEESPSPGLDADQRQRLEEAAVRLAQQVGYVGAGTVEFLCAGDSFYFLEVNARLQVEHPVTEAVTGIDLVQAQLRIAAGEGLGLVQEEISPRGHAIEARLYAEDPDAGFLPAAGPVLHLELPAGPGVRVDSGITADSEVSVYYDPLLAKIVAWAEDRDRACRRLGWALGDTRILGLKTNQRFLRRLLGHPAFLAGDLHTGFIDEHRDGLIGGEAVPDEVSRVAAALAFLELAGAGGRRSAVVAADDDPYSPWRSA